jgi:AcrR family transcriptional regulator
MNGPPTRRERQAMTRERLLDVAAEELVANGYMGTSLDRVAELAGFSKGAVYSNFANKEELVLEVLDRHFLHRLDILQERLLAAPENIEGRVEAFTGWWEEMVSHESWGVLILEFASATRDRPAIQDELAARERKIIGFTTMLVNTEIERFGLELPMSPREVASVLVSLGSGLSFSRMLDPTIPIHIVSDLARVLFVDAAKPAEDQPSMTLDEPE